VEQNVKKYSYVEYGTPHKITITEQEILNSKWATHWKNNMIKRFGEGHEFITDEECIDEFCVVNWAWEEND
jgi:hypothetical protein